MTADQNEQVKIALAIYRGLPDGERQERMDIIRRAKYYRTDFSGKVYDPESRTIASVLLPYIEQAEREIQAERAELVRLRKAVQTVRVVHHYQDTDSAPMYGNSSNPDTARLVRAVGIFGGIAAVMFGGGIWILQSGYLPYIAGGGLLVFFLSALPKPGAAATDGEKKTTESGAQNIHINITGHGGQIHVTQGG